MNGLLILGQLNGSRSLGFKLRNPVDRDFLQFHGLFADQLG
jgi:hypothetical protein